MHFENIFQKPQIWPIDWHIGQNLTKIRKRKHNVTEIESVLKVVNIESQGSTPKVVRLSNTTWFGSRTTWIHNKVVHFQIS